MTRTFLQQLAAHILKNFQHPDRVAVVLTNRRAELFLREALSREAKKALISPFMLPIDAFVEELSGLRSAGQAQLLFYLYDAYRKVLGEKAEDFDSFIKWAPTVLQDYNEVDRYLVDANALYKNLENAKELERWGVEPGEQPTQMMKDYMAFWHSLPAVYHNLQETCLAKGAGHQGLQYRKAVEKLDNSAEAFYAKHQIDHILFAGFNALNRAEEKILTHLLDGGRASILWDADAYYLDNPQHEAGLFMRNYRKRWRYFTKHPFAWISDDLHKGEKEIEILGISGNVGQAKLVGQLMARPDVDATHQTALVLGDEKQLLPILQSLPPTLKALNVTMGVPLTDLPVSAFLETLIEMHDGARQNERGFAFYHKNLMAVLQLQAGAKLVGGRAIADHIRESVIKENRVYVTPDFLARKIVEKSPETGLPGLLHGPQTPLQFCQNLRLFFLAMKESEATTDPIENESHYGIYRMLTQLQSLLEEGGAQVQSMRTFRLLMQTLLRAESLSLYGEPLTGIQIMGVLETRNLDFETVVLTSVNEGVLPSGKKHNSFIPYDLKREAGLPTYEDKDAIYAYHFYRILQRAKKVVLVYNTDADALGGSEPSRFIRQLEMEWAPAVGQKISHRVVQLNPRESDVRPVEEIAKTPEITQRLKEWAAYGISPSALSAYLWNPLEFYQRYVLRISEDEELTEHADNRLLGDIVHRALQEVYGGFVGLRLSADKLGAKVEEVEDFVRAAFAELYPNGNLETGKNHLILKVALHMVSAVIQFDLHRLKAGREIEIVALEEKWGHAFSHPDLDFEVKLHGNVDRVEKVDGHLHIVDYKTGQNRDDSIRLTNSFPFDGKSGYALQLLFYKWLALKEKKIQNAATWLWYPLKNNRMAITFSNLDEAGWLEMFESRLAQLIQHIVIDDVPFRESLEEIEIEQL